MLSITLKLRNLALEFVPAAIEFNKSRTSDLFGSKNNKTLEQTIQHRRYIHLFADVRRNYPNSLTRQLGDFLLELKRRGDPFYRQFLNPYGDESYCQFRLNAPELGHLKGLYCFTVSGSLKYIGKSTDTFERRINQGYGCIHPKNCYRDGQATNCHLNALIANCAQELELFAHPMSNNEVIGITETALIATYKPEWNIQLK
jgi:hypothetical protein